MAGASVVPSSQATSQVTVSLAESVTVAVRATGVPARTTCHGWGSVTRTVGAALTTVRTIELATGGFTPSLAVSVTTKRPSSLQLIVVWAAVASANEQVVPGSTSESARYDQLTAGVP